MLIFPKINLGLHIIEKLPSGFHAIETVFYPIDNYQDELQIAVSNSFSFTVKNADFNCDSEDNLCVKAYRILQMQYQLPPVKMELTKQIPSGAGLGGGSADAAATLIMLNQIFEMHLTHKQLHNYASQLGSDTAFFIYKEPMLATERGELLTPISLALTNYKIEIVCPNISISTAQAYAEVTPKKPNVSLNEIIKMPITEWKNHLVNDFEETVFKHYPELLEIKNNFYKQGAVYSSLSGSGSAIYGIFEL